MTGVSGSGKSSLAFDTIFAEGQAQVHESPRPRTQAAVFDQLQKPHVESIEGLPPTIAIELRRSAGTTPLDGRDHDRDLRLHATVLAAAARRRAGTWMNAAARSVASRSQLRAATQIVDTLMDWPTGTRHGLLAGGARQEGLSPRGAGRPAEARLCPGLGSTAGSSTSARPSRKAATIRWAWAAMNCTRSRRWSIVW